MKTNCQGWKRGKGKLNVFDFIFLIQVSLMYVKRFRKFQNIVCMIFLIDHCTQNFFLLESQHVSTPSIVFLTQAQSVKSVFSPLVNNFWLRYASPYKFHFLLSISHDLQFSNTKNLTTDLCSSSELSVWFTAILNSLKTMAWWLECLPMAQETWIQSQVDSYQRLKKWYVTSPCLTISIIRYGSKLVPFPTPWSCSYQKGSLRVTLYNSRHLYLLRWFLL